MRSPCSLALSCACLLGPLSAALPALAAPPSPPPPAAARPTGAAGELESFVTAYFGEMVKQHPTRATDLGLHDYDGQLEDYSAPALARERAALGRWEKRHAEMTARIGASLPLDKQADLALVGRSIRSRLVELDKVQRHRHSASFYPDLASETIYVLIERDFAPEDVRLRSVIARERRVPSLLAQGQRNLAAVPAVSIDILRRQLPGIIGFFATDVGKAFPHALAGPAKAEFAKVNGAVMAALKAYGQLVERKIAPSAKAQFAIGEALFREKLAADEMIDTPVADLLAEGEAEVRRLQALFKQTATKISPSMPPAQVQKVMASDYPPPDKLIASVQARLAGLRYFLQQHAIVTVPSEVVPRVEETPPFMRATTLASMFTPGPFEKKATDAMYNVTLPDRSWPRQKVDDYMSGAFNRALIDIVSIHEAFPGHYTQFLWMHQVASTARKYQDVSSNSEGWAHYCEQMMLDEGWGAGDEKLRLAQLQDALLRAARYVAGIRMHTRGMTLEQAVAYFRDEGYQNQQVAEVEARRGTEDPTYLYYTWGKLRILELREAYKAKLGKSYSLRKFHDAVLAQGSIPLPLLRRALLQ